MQKFSVKAPTCLGYQAHGITVADFIRDALDNEVPLLSRELLPRTSKTKRSTTALGYVAGSRMRKAEAEAIRPAMLGRQMVFTRSSKPVAERAIFFVLLPYFGLFCGDAGMRTTSADISRDEQVHVACNSSAKNSESRGRPVLTNLEKATINGPLAPAPKAPAPPPPPAPAPEALQDEKTDMGEDQAV